MSLTRVLVCGGRDASIEQSIADQCIADILEDYEGTDVEFVSGTARGGDALGENFADAYGYNVIQFKPDWKTYGRAAGPIRNQAMVDYIEESDNPVVIAFWDGQSKGTRSTIKYAQSKHIPVRIVRYKNFEQTIEGGIQINDGKLSFNWKEDEPEDVLPLVDQRIIQSRKHGHVYYYAFKANKGHDDWNAFLSAFKHSDDSYSLKKLTDQLANKFIAKFNYFDCILYPKSSSSLNEMMIESLHKIDDSIPAYPISKADCSKIQFDWKSFENKFNGDDESYNKSVKSLEKMMQRINKSDKFSMQKQVLPRYRKFVRNFLEIGDLEYALDDIVNSETILVLDDIVTSGSTTNEIINMLDDIGYEGDVVIFSIIYNK